MPSRCMAKSTDMMFPALYLMMATFNFSGFVALEISLL